MLLYRQLLTLKQCTNKKTIPELSLIATHLPLINIPFMMGLWLKANTAKESRVINKVVVDGLGLIHSLIISTIIAFEYYFLYKLLYFTLYSSGLIETKEIDLNDSTWLDPAFYYLITIILLVPLSSLLIGFLQLRITNKFKSNQEYRKLSVRQVITAILIGIVLSWIIPTLTSFIASSLYLNRDRFIMSGEGMTPTIKAGDGAIINRNFDRDSLKRGQLLVFNSPIDTQNRLSRLIGLPGEKVIIENEYIRIVDSSGEENVLYEDYTFNFSTGWIPVDNLGPTFPCPPDERRLNRWEYQLDSNEIFVISDNRQQADDSRCFVDNSAGPGKITVDDVIGVVEKIYNSQSVAQSGVVRKVITPTYQYGLKTEPERIPISSRYYQAPSLISIESSVSNKPYGLVISDELPADANRISVYGKCEQGDIPVEIIARDKIVYEDGEEYQPRPLYQFEVVLNDQNICEQNEYQIKIFSDERLVAVDNPKYDFSKTKEKILKAENEFKPTLKSVIEDPSLVTTFDVQLDREQCAENDGDESKISKISPIKQISPTIWAQTTFGEVKREPESNYNAHTTYFYSDPEGQVPHPDLKPFEGGGCLFTRTQKIYWVNDNLIFAFHDGGHETYPLYSIWRDGEWVSIYDYFFKNYPELTIENGHATPLILTVSPDRFSLTETNYCCDSVPLRYPGKQVEFIFNSRTLDLIGTALTTRYQNLF